MLPTLLSLTVQSHVCRPRVYKTTQIMNVCTAQLGKIGRLRRNAACLLAVVLHSADGAESDEAVALTKLLEHYPQAPKPLPKPVITKRVSSAGRPHELLSHARAGTMMWLQ